MNITETAEGQRPDRDLGSERAHHEETRPCRSQCGCSPLRGAELGRQRRRRRRRHPQSSPV